MGEQSIVYGRIQLYGHREPYGPAREFLVNLPEDEIYPEINSRNFSLGAEEYEPSYGEPVFAFAAVYKYLEDSFLEFIIKFEYILRHIDFYSVKLELQTEFYSDYGFFWKRKYPGERIDPEEYWTVMEDWYFGEGPRSMFGSLEGSWKEEDRFWHTPLDFEADVIAAFNQFLEEVSDVPLGEVIQLKGYEVNKQGSHRLGPVITYLYTYKEIDYGYSNEDGYWIKKLQPVAPIISARIGRGHLRKNEQNEQPA